MSGRPAARLLYRRAMAAWEAGDLDAAFRTCRAVLDHAPRHAGALHMLGAIALRAGRPDTAAAFADHLLAYAPDDPDALVLKARAERAGGRPDAARALLDRAVEAAPGHAGAWQALGLARRRLGDPAGAVAALERAVAAAPDDADALVNLAAARRDRGAHEGAARAAEAAMDRAPGNVEACVNAAAARLKQGRLRAARRHAEAATARAPDHAPAWLNLAVALSGAGRARAAVEAAARAVALRPGHAAAHSTLLTCLQYRPAVSPEGLFVAHRAWAVRHADPATPAPPPARPAAHRPLRVGFVSPDFGRHPVGFFLLPLLRGRDPAAFTATLYSTRLGPADDVTAALRAAADAWVDVAALDDAALAERVRGEGMDVLVDLSGHTAGHRLLAFARRPAPVQVTWAGYAGTTGLAAMDALLADARQVPSGAEGPYAERVVRLPGVYVPYAPPPDAPPVATPDPGRPPTFGSFNNPAKLNERALRLWAEVLLAVPEARLLLKFRGMTDPDVAGRLRRVFADAGVAAERVTLEEGAPQPAFLARYGAVDVALDPRPYNGGLTTLEALWMGVPVVTWPGRTFAGRHAAAHLHAAGLDDLVAADGPAYVARCVALMADGERRAHLRATLRDAVARGPSGDGATFARAFHAALHGLVTERTGEVA